MMLGGSVEEYLSEKEQWEWIKAQVRENGPAVILAVAVVAAAMFGWRWWQGHLDAGRLEASAKYTQMVAALDDGDRTRAFVLFGELERDYTASPYTDQARLLAARLYVRGRRARSGGRRAHRRDAEFEGSGPGPGRAAAAGAGADRSGKADGALATLNGGNPEPSMRHYHEVRGDAYYAKGDRAAALKEYRGAQAPRRRPRSSLLRLPISQPRRRRRCPRHHPRRRRPNEHQIDTGDCGARLWRRFCRLSPPVPKTRASISRRSSRP